MEAPQLPEVATQPPARSHRPLEALGDNLAMQPRPVTCNQPDLGMKTDSAETTPNLRAMTAAPSKSEVSTDNATPPPHGRPLRLGPAAGRWKWIALAITAGLAILVCVAVSLSYEHRDPDGSYTRLDFRGAARLQVAPEVDGPELAAAPGARPKSSKPPWYQARQEVLTTRKPGPLDAMRAGHRSAAPADRGFVPRRPGARQAGRVDP